MCSQCNEKLNRKLNTLKCCSKYLHVRHMYPPRFFSPSNWKVVALQTDTQTQRICCLQWQTTPSPERKVTAPLFHFFEGGGVFFSQHLLYTVLNFFSIMFLDNVSTPIVPQHCVWIEPLLGGLFRRSQVSCTLYGGHFKLIYLVIFHSETILKGSFSLWGRWD